MQIKLADFSHKQELLELWQEAFGNSEYFILDFLNAYMFAEYNVPIIVADGKVVSALYLVNFELYSSTVSIGKCSYLFAAATREAYRRRGYMSELVKYSVELYKNRDISALFLFPQEHSEKLFKFYEKFGFKSIYQTKKICANANCTRPQNIDLSGFRLVNYKIDDEIIFENLYDAYAEFTANQALSPLKDRLFYFKCASSYLSSPGANLAVFEREINNNVEKFCYVFYKKFENNFYIDDIIMADYSRVPEKYNEMSEILAAFILDSGNDINLEMNVLPDNKDSVKLGMMLALNKKIESIVNNIKSPVYLNMYMNV